MKGRRNATMASCAVRVRGYLSAPDAPEFNEPERVEMATQCIRPRAFRNLIKDWKANRWLELWIRKAGAQRYVRVTRPLGARHP